MSVLTGDSAELHEAGEDVENLGAVGSLTCVSCGYALALSALELLPTCPSCGGSSFRRTSIFDQPTVDLGVAAPPEGTPSWLEELRSGIEASGHYVAYQDHGAPVLIEVEEGWTRIGRSASADIRLDDPTVSRRHALIVSTPEGKLRAMDDRSLNGLFVNGERVDWVPLSDGDELEVGRYRLHVIQA